MDYYEKLFRASGSATRVCWYCFVGIVTVLVFAAILSGCRTHKVADSTVTNDLVRTEYIERIVKDTVTVTVEVPAEAKERQTRDSTSFLETSFARSTASLTWRDGEPWLFHSLENKPQQIQKPVEVESKEKTRTIYRTRYVTRTKTVEAKTPWWRKMLWSVSIGVNVIVAIAGLIFLFKKRISS